MDPRAGPFGEDRGARRPPRPRPPPAVAAICARGSFRPAASSRAWRQAMIEASSACSEMRRPEGATTSNPSSIAPVLGEGRLPKVLPMKHLKAFDAAGDQSGELGDVVLGQQAVEAEIDIGLLCGCLLGAQLHHAAGRRMGVRHLEDRGRAAHGGGGGAGLPILLVRVAGLAEMDMDVDRAGQDVQAGDIHHLLRRGHRCSGTDGEDYTILDRHVGAKASAAGHYRAAGQHQVCGHRCLR